MAKVINNMNDLEKALMPTMTKMVDVMAERVYQTLNYFWVNIIAAGHRIVTEGHLISCDLLSK